MYIFTVNDITECDLMNGNIYLHTSEDKMGFQIHINNINYQIYGFPKLKYR